MHTVGLPRTCLGCTNFVFFVFGLVCSAICIWCAFNTEFFRDVNYTITKSSYVASIANFMNLKFIVTPMTTILIPISVLAMLTSCCGLLGAGCKVKCAIKSYIFLVTIISGVAFWIFFISGVYNIYTNNPKTKIYLQSSLKNYYGKENDFFTFSWNYIMIHQRCCGVINYTDFAHSNWRTNNLDKLYPVQCCVLTNKTALLPVSPECTQSLDENIQSYKDFGCMLALRDSIIRNKTSLIVYIVMLGIIYGIILLFAYCIIRGEPLLSAMAGGISEFLPKKPQQNINPVVPSTTSLENMMFLEEPPKKVVKVVSAVNPFQTYKYTPNAYHPSQVYSQTMPYNHRHVQI